MVVTLVGGFLTYEPAVATPYGRRVLEALRAATPPPGQATTGRDAPATARLRRTMALDGAKVLWVADPVLAALEVPDTPLVSPAEAAGGGETVVSG